MTGRRKLDSPQAVAEAAAHWIVEQLAQRDGRLSVCLSGGTTPRRAYKVLRSPELQDRVSWDRIHWFWGDERVVPSDDPRSNAGTACRDFLDHIPAPPENLHVVPTHLPSRDAVAAAYEEDLKNFHGGASLEGKPLFDLILLGVGTDGHTASLFPGSAVLDEQEKWVAATDAPDGQSRVTLTVPALRSRRAAAVLATGQEKREILARIFAGEELPVTQVAAGGEVQWFIDDAAWPED
ncbi:MAG: 6-phosphogluconolactonase [Alphaproteobacteria bacterium]|nr:6-phosphogluconolactonase [Alphaproteobacteria bacterium]